MKLTTRVLIVKLAALGDAIMASTLVPAIRTRWPLAHVTWVAGRRIAPVVRLLDGIDSVIEVHETALLNGNTMQAGAALISAWRRIGRNYDVALIAHTDKRYAWLSRLSGASTTHRFADQLGPRDGKWHGSEYLRLLGNDAASAAEFATFRVSALPPAPHVPGSGPLVVVVPGGARNVLRDDALRRWPIASWTATVGELIASGYRVASVGDVSDAPEGALCAQAGATDFTGRTTLLELAGILNAADVVITHDSGALHLAQLLGRPVVALFGPTVPNERIPHFARTTVVTRAMGLACAPCYDGHSYADCALNICLTRAPVAAVIDAVRAFIE